MSLKQASFDFDFQSEAIEPESVLTPEEKLLSAVKENRKRMATEESPVEHAVITASADEKKSTRGRMKISEMKASVLMVDIPEDEELFSKSYYSIGKVSEMFNVNPSLLRFWENEFSILKPRKNGKGDRFFRPHDIKNLQLIYHLLRERKFTIEGAKDYLKRSARADEKFALIESLKRLKAFLTELKTSL
ncbi:MAG: MerR family transcriptional regulator [Ferruginibacter sp.]|nr:MerR family transcriptional regulator [Ferruginibacter sp.]